MELQKRINGPKNATNVNEILITQRPIPPQVQTHENNQQGGTTSVYQNNRATMDSEAIFKISSKTIRSIILILN